MNNKANVRLVVMIFLVIGFMGLWIFDFQTSLGTQFERNISNNSSRTYKLLNDTSSSLQDYGTESLATLEKTEGSGVISALVITGTGILQILKSIISFVKLVPTFLAEFGLWIGITAKYQSLIYAGILITVIFFIIYLWVRYAE